MNEDVQLVALLRANKGVAWHRITTVVENAGTAQGLVTGEVEAPNDFARSLVRAVGEEHLEDARREVSSWREREDMEVWSILDEAYPSSLRTIFDRPPYIFCRGAWDDEQDGRGVAVVGTRQASDEGLAQARRMAYELVRRSVTVLSGLAVGIDGEAHRAALDARGRTVAVLGSGLDHIYPAEHEGLAEEIVAAGGALLSPFVPSQRPARTYTFAIRNAVMSGLSRGTIVIEAGPTSGARMQARLALQHGRPVFLPRPLVETHAWARSYAEKGRYGARALAVEDIGDVLRALETGEPDLPDLQLKLALEH